MANIRLILSFGFFTTSHFPWIRARKVHGSRARTSSAREPIRIDIPEPLIKKVCSLRMTVPLERCSLVSCRWFLIWKSRTFGEMPVLKEIYLMEVRLRAFSRNRITVLHSGSRLSGNGRSSFRSCSIYNPPFFFPSVIRFLFLDIMAFSPCILSCLRLRSGCRSTW